MCVCACLLEVHFMEGWSYSTATISSPIYGRICHARNMSWSAMSYEMDLNIWVMNYLYVELWSQISFHHPFIHPNVPEASRSGLKFLLKPTMEIQNFSSPSSLDIEVLQSATVWLGTHMTPAEFVDASIFNPHALGIFPQQIPKKLTSLDIFQIVADDFFVQE